MKGLAEGQDVYVITPAGMPIDARVEEVGSGEMLVMLFTTDRDPVDKLAGDTVDVQFVNRRGVCRIEGVAHRSKGAATALRFKATGDVRVIQRRNFVRVDAVVPVQYHPIGKDAWRVDTHTLNVSGGGFLLASPEGVRMGETMEFTLDLGEGEGYEGGELTAVGIAVRQTDGGALGIEFVNISEDDRKRLIRFVFAREVHARKVLKEAG